MNENKKRRFSIGDRVRGISFRILLVVFLASAALLAAPGGREYRTVAAPAFVPGEVIVQYRTYVSGSAAMSYSRRLGLPEGVRALRHTIRGKGPMHVNRIRPGQNLQQAIAAFQSNPDVEYAQPNYVYRALTAPNDTKYGDMWGLKNTGQTVSDETYSPSVGSSNNPGTSGMDIGAETAWDTITNCSSVVVAVIDSGVNYNHEDLTSNMANGSYTCPGGTGSRGCDFVGTGDSDPMDPNGHGTHVAGTIGAVGNNSTGTTGVCWQATILAVRVLNAAGSGVTADIVEGINFAAGTSAGQGQAKVINMSLGNSTSDTAMSNAIAAARDNDVVVVVAAGNDGNNHSTGGQGKFPCDFTHENILCVAAVDQAFTIADFSDRDTNATAANRHVDLGAPGTNVHSTYFGTETEITDDFNSAGSLDWTVSGTAVWAYDGGCITPPMLVAPTAWCSGTAPANSINSVVYKNFNLSAYDAGASLSLGLWLDLDDSSDFFQIRQSPSGGNPVVTSGNSTLLSQFGPNIHTGGFADLSFDVSTCNTAACTVGFWYVTDTNTNQSFDGVGLVGFTITGKTFATNQYKVLDGTSMAAPHVAGIATMIRARNPNFTYTDTIAAIAEGGTVVAGLSGTTRYGKVANAANGLKYIPQTTGVGLSTP